jgi:penicillin-binding protein 1A
MLKGTHYYNPVMFPERALKRRNLVLQQMALTGALTPAEAQAQQQRPLGVKLTRQDELDDAAPHFTAQAKRWALNWADEHDVDLYSEGLTIETTLDSRLQAVAEKAVERQTRLLQAIADVEWATATPRSARSPEAYAQMAKGMQPFRHFFDTRPELLAAFLKEMPEFQQALKNGQTEAQALKALKADPQVMARMRQAHTRLEAGFLAMDPQTGEVKAWVGSRDFAADQFDHVAQAARQPGSTFKPIVYGAALESGIGPERTYLDGPVEVQLDDRTVWRPTDMQGFSGRSMTLRDGLVYSKNTITAQVSQEVGLQRIVALAQAMGIDRSKLDAVPSLALGTSPVSLYEMVNVYSTIAAQGTRHKPLFVRRIKDRQGQVLAEFASQSQRVLSPDTAVDLIDMMRGVVNVGTGAMVKARFNLGADIAGKTGTTQNNTDGWFILMHPNLVAGAWVGFNDQRVFMRSEYWGQGGHNAVLLVGDFFKEAIKGRMVDTGVAFPPPRRPPVITTYAPPPDEVTEAAVSDSDIATGEPGAPRAIAVTGSTEVTRTSTSGTTTYGDSAGVEAMRHSSAPPKSAEELERAFGRDGRRRASGTLGDVLPDSRAAAAPPPGDDASAAAPAAEPAEAPPPQ